MANPVRITNGMNCGIDRNNPISKFINAPVQLGTWGFYYTDFSSLDSWLPDPGATAGTGSLNSQVSGGISSFREFGILDLATGAGANEFMAAYLSSAPIASHTASTPWTIPAGNEWVLSIRLRLHNATEGFWAGIASAADIANGATASVDESAAAFVNGFLFRKAVGSAPIVADAYNASALLMPQLTILPTPTASTITYRFTAHYKNGLLEVFLGQMTSTGGSQTRVASIQMPQLLATAQFGAVLGVKTPTTIVHLLTDNFLFAVKTDR